MLSNNTTFQEDQLWRHHQYSGEKMRLVSTNGHNSIKFLLNKHETESDRLRPVPENKFNIKRLFEYIYLALIRL